ncbi:kinesin [Aulographum hederae CBS 113979]|uniref:Kinesin-like protein n=1 Tax=Aulographum hederae CBS 113979 TaxID=1176131 RepID=A0A6G1GRV8_9PEZI|nr:kinesin [Aulographum hederae CBS 113979]
MEPPSKSSASLFDVYLRLRPSFHPNAERFMDVEELESGLPKHITIKPPASDQRKRAVEKFAFTSVFQEDAKQIDLFEGTGVVPLIEGVLGPENKEGRDGLLATLGVTGSGKSHTILGSKSQRGLTQMTLDVLFQSTGSQLVHPSCINAVFPSIAAADVSEAQLFPAAVYLDNIYGDGQSERGGYNSRAQTPMMERSSFLSAPGGSRRNIPRPSALPQSPSVQDFVVEADQTAEYALVVSMYEVYNDRIFDLLTASMSTNKIGTYKRRALLFKSTEQSPDRKVVAGLRKVVCSNLDEALMVLETGLLERRVAGTGSNAVSSRSHGFFCVEVKKRNRVQKGPWSSSTLTIVDLAGSERARNAKTAGATLAEAGKINESLMYLGQCMQMQSDNQEGSKNIVPFRQCKLTELLFSNSFPNASNHHSHHHRNPQKAIMIVTADPMGDFNATSQILRYSALAREVTIPRIPSVTSTILSGAVLQNGPKHHGNSSGRSSPTALHEELEHAQQEVARLNEELDVISLQLQEETSRRQNAEHSWHAATSNLETLEAEIREQCFAEMEERIEAERRRWKGAWDEENDRQDEHIDRKIEILARGINVYEDETSGAGEGDGAPADDRFEGLERENQMLKRKLDDLEREKLSRSPSKKMRVLKSKKWEVDSGENLSP